MPQFLNSGVFSMIPCGDDDVFSTQRFRNPASVFSMNSRFGRRFALIAVLACSRNVDAQTNTWISPTSGSWEQSSNWSQDALPSSNQVILFTNSGWKALAISSDTTQNFPQTLNVSSVTVSSPTNSSNTLLINYAGLQTPLVVGGTAYNGSFIVCSNASVLVLSSALQVNDSFSGTPDQQSYGAFSIGGTFSESQSAQVTAEFLRVGNIGPGIFNLTNSLLSASYEYVDGSGTFNQQGGTNLPGVLEIHPGGIYNFYAGEIDGTLQVDPSGTLNVYGGEIDGTMNVSGGTVAQQGGQMNAPINVSSYGTFYLSNGIASGGIALPSNDQSAGTFVQSGGTNQPGTLSVGFGIAQGAGFGYYTLSNGLLTTSGTTVRPWGNFQQQGGFHTVSGALNVTGALGSQNSSVSAVYTLGDGLLTANSLNASICQFNQNGGTNQISGNILIGPSLPASQYTLKAGTLLDASMTIQPSFNGGFFQNGGVHVVTNQLTINGSASGSHGYVLAGGQLVVPNIQVSGGATFQQTGGTLIQGGTITLANGQWHAATGNQQLGQLQLGVSGGTNSIITMPAGPSVLKFADSSSLTWSNQAALLVQNWNGSIYGRGSQQIVFGASAGALTPQQVAQIRFQNPVGISGTFPAQMLANGEIVPGPVLNTSHSNGKLVLQWTGSAILQTSTNAAGPYTDLPGLPNAYTNLFTDAQRFFRLRQ